jgi:hypothetical protein
MAAALNVTSYTVVAADEELHKARLMTSTTRRTERANSGSDSAHMTCSSWGIHVLFYTVRCQPDDVHHAAHGAGGRRQRLAVDAQDDVPRLHARPVGGAGLDDLGRQHPRQEVQRGGAHRRDLGGAGGGRQLGSDGLRVVRQWLGSIVLGPGTMA